MPARPKTLWWSLAIVALGSFSQACVGASSKPPSPPPKHQAQKTQQPAEQEPYHVAPPPAYGNKVVLARSDRR